MSSRTTSTGYRTIDHTADIGIFVWGENLKQVFASAAKGMFSLITDLRHIKPIIKKEIEVSAGDRESLMVNWLNDLIYSFDVDQFLLRNCDITKLTDTYLKAKVCGEKIDLNRHSIKVGIKSTTYHQLEIKENDGYQARIFFDI